MPKRCLGVVNVTGGLAQPSPLRDTVGEPDLARVIDNPDGNSNA